MNKFFFVLFRGLSLFKRFIGLNMVSIFSLTGLFLMLHVGFSFGNGISAVVNSMAKFDSIRVYISDHSESTFELLGHKLEKYQQIEELTLITPDKTKELVIAGTGVDGMSDLSENLFPAYVNVSIKKDFRQVQVLEGLATEFQDLPHVVSVSYGKEWAENFEKGKKTLSSLLLMAAVLFATLSLIIVYQTVSIGLYKYRREISVYNLVGGTRMFILFPFLIMSVVTGVFCFLLSMLFFGIIHNAALQNVRSLLGIDIALSGRYITQFLAFSIFIPAVATAFGVRNYLRKAAGSEKD